MRPTSFHTRLRRALFGSVITLLIITLGPRRALADVAEAESTTAPASPPAPPTTPPPAAPPSEPAQGEATLGPAPSANREASAFTRRTIAYVLGGAALAFAGGGTAFGVAALNDKSDFDKTHAKDKGDEGNDFAVYSDIAFGAAVALATTSIVLYLTDPATPDTAARAPEKSASFSVAPSAFMTTRGGGAGALFRF